QRRGGPGRVPALLRRAVPLVDVAAARPDRDRLVPHRRHLQPGLVHARGDPLPVHHRLGRRGAGAGVRLRGRRGGHRDRGVLLRAPDADGAHVSRGSFRSVARALAWRNVHHWFTKPTLILPGVLFPMFFFTAFAGGLSRVASIPGFDYDANYTTWIYGFVLLQASTFGGVFTWFSVARDFESGFARRLMLGATNRGGLIGGYWISALGGTPRTGLGGPGR